ncbi:MAG: hypothetical protein ACLFTG_10950 [Alphaproteobacteria bacterium]
MPRRLTRKQIAVRDRNRRNAQRSTGPKTAEGKARASRNARRHGLAAGDVVDPRERGEAEAHRTGLEQALRPRDHLEAGIVERMARALARLDRIDRLESGVRDERGDRAGALPVDPAALRRLSGLDRYRGEALATLRRARRELDAARRISENEAKEPVFPSRSKG